MLETICSVEKAKEIKDMIGDHESFVCHQVVTVGAFIVNY